MAAHTLKFVQFIPTTIEKAWDFFSDPANLPAITPAELSFKIISQHHGNKMYAGQIIEYNVSPIAGLKMYWMTEITHIKPYEYFIDEQRYGPYAMWNHQHFFKSVESGVEMTDIIHYKNPMGIFGSLADGIIVKPGLKKIFGYRFKKVEELFGK